VEVILTRLTVSSTDLHLTVRPGSARSIVMPSEVPVQVLHKKPFKCCVLRLMSHLFLARDMCLILCVYQCLTHIACPRSGLTLATSKNRRQSSQSLGFFSLVISKQILYCLPLSLTNVIESVFLHDVPYLLRHGSLIMVRGELQEISQYWKWL
jgi:hypothetical protein